MRILHILDHSIPLHSGYTFRTRAILREQHALGWETVHVTSPKQGPGLPAEETVDGLLFHRTPVPGGLATRLPVAKELALMAATTRRVAEVARRTAPDVLHAHSPVLNAIPALRVGRALGIPVVYEVRAFWEDAAVDHGTSREWGLRYRMTRALETWALRRVDAVTTICEGLRRDMMARGLDADRITVIPNAVNVEDFSSGRPDPDLRSSLGLEGRTIIGYIGSFYAYEGLDLLVEALPAILAGAPDARLLLVGGGPEDAALRERVAALGLADKVVFTGRVPHAQVQKYYDLVDLLAYPRKSMRLTDLVTPLKPLEAMAMRKLLIASDVGGHRELIEHGRTGILFRAGDAADLARNTLALLADRRRWGSILDEGRRYVAEVRNWPASVARYRGIYDSLAHGGQRG